MSWLRKVFTTRTANKLVFLNKRSREEVLCLDLEWMKSFPGVGPSMIEEVKNFQEENKEVENDTEPKCPPS